MIFLIRHAHAGTRAAWPGPDGDRPLSEQGRREAAALAALLAAEPISRIVSSPRRRCLETVGPLAAARGITVEANPALDEDAVPGDARAWIEQPVPGVALCSHANVIRDLLTALSEAGVALPGGPAAGRGSVWELPVAGGRIVSGHYRPQAG